VSARRAMSLVEVMVGVGIVAGLGMGIFMLLNGSRGNAARATDAMAAATIASRMVDRLQALGYPVLFKRVGPVHDADLQFVKDPAAKPGAVAMPLDWSGVTWSATEQISEQAPGLLRLEIVLAWKRDNVRSARGRSMISAVKYLADPASALRVRPGRR